MHRAGSRPLAASLAFAAAILATPAPVPATPGDDASFIGTYTVTQVGGAGVQRMELHLGADGRASLRTDFSRHSQRPVASAPVPPVLEKGTWRARKGRAVVHIISTSDDDASAAEDQRPQYSDLTFALTGCLLRLVSGTTRHELEFSKKNCAGNAG